jgi:hypothetical protein
MTILEILIKHADDPRSQEIYDRVLKVNPSLLNYDQSYDDRSFVLCLLPWDMEEEDYKWAKMFLDLRSEDVEAHPIGTKIGDRCAVDLCNGTLEYDGQATLVCPYCKRKVEPEIGWEDGYRCGRNGCEEVLTYKPTSEAGCSCHVSAPCAHCTSSELYCPACGFIGDEPDREVDYWFCSICDYRITDEEYRASKHDLPCPRCRDGSLQNYCLKLKPLEEKSDAK